MDLELLPDTGVASIRLGTPVGEAVRAGQAMGFLPDANDVTDVTDSEVWRFREEDFDYVLVTSLSFEGPLRRRRRRERPPRPPPTGRDPRVTRPTFRVVPVRPGMDVHRAAAPLPR
ncbi:hypothetical protein [Streptomyces niveus]